MSASSSAACKANSAISFKKILLKSAIVLTLFVGYNTPSLADVQPKAPQTKEDLRIIVRERVGECRIGIAPWTSLSYLWDTPSKKNCNANKEACNKLKTLQKGFNKTVYLQTLKQLNDYSTSNESKLLKQIDEYNGSDIKKLSKKLYDDTAAFSSSCNGNVGGIKNIISPIKKAYDELYQEESQ